MTSKNTVAVSLVKDDYDSKKLFTQWNKEKKIDIKCGSSGCENIVDNNAYIVSNITNHNAKFILPLCRECYNMDQNSKAVSSSDIADYGSVIIVERPRLIKV